MSFKYCPICCGQLVNKVIDDHLRQICEKCGFILYRNPTPAVAVILMQDDRVLLVKRKYDPKAGDWSLPAGFMEYDEEPEQTALRETREETNLNIELIDLLGVYAAFDDPRVHVILIVYEGKILNGELRPGDDAEEAKFFSLSALPQNIAFNSHRKVLNKLIDRI